MRVFLTGATGVVGRRLVPLLQNAGHEVTAAVRSTVARAELTTKGERAKSTCSIQLPYPEPLRARMLSSTSRRTFPIRHGCSCHGPGVKTSPESLTGPRPACGPTAWQIIGVPVPDG